MGCASSTPSTSSTSSKNPATQTTSPKREAQDLSLSQVHLACGLETIEFKKTQIAEIDDVFDKGTAVVEEFRQMNSSLENMIKVILNNRYLADSVTLFEKDARGKP